MAPSFELKIANHGGHDKFRELCALYSSGTLTKRELEQLNEHLPSCSECRQLLREYSDIVRSGIPALSDEPDIVEVAGFDAELLKGKTRLLATIDSPRDTSFAATKHTDSIARDPHMRSPFRPNTLLAYGMALLLIVCAGVGGYLIGMRPIERSPNKMAQTVHDQPGKTETASTERLLAQHEEEVRKLSSEISQLQHDLSTLKRAAGDSDRARSQEASRSSALNDENARLRADHEQAAQRLNDAQTSLAQLKQEVNQLRSDRDSAVLQSNDAEKRIDAFKAQLHSQAETISEQQRLLAADRDIRELMGARDLLLADLFDIDQNGRNKKPFGRIFYTKNKSLVFYAFDLDRQPGLRNAGVFQVWGARAADKGKGAAFNMGIFYMDNEAMRRWVLKFDDPKILAQIDSVFVTVEPHGGSNKPSGKQLLFASLRGEPNHP